MEKPIEYKEMAARHIYAYHNTAGKGVFHAVRK